MGDPEAHFDDAAARVLAPWLDCLGAPEADRGFRLRLREQFVHGHFATAGADPEPALRSALESVREQQARPEFKDALCAAFVSGKDLPAAAGAAPPRVRRVPSSARRQSWRLRLLVAGALAAAAALVLILRTPATVWELASEPVAVVVDGRPVTTELNALLAGARTLETGERALRLRFGDEVVIEVGARSRVDLSAWSDGADAARRALSIDHGALRVATGPAFDRDTMLLVASGPELEARVVGTAFGLDVYPEKGTCLCVTEGTVAAIDRVEPGKKSDVPAGHMRFTFKAGGAVAGDEPVEEHVGPVVDLARFWR